jgi:hypothetical protein
MPPSMSAVSPRNRRWIKHSRFVFRLDSTNFAP